MTVAPREEFRHPATPLEEQLEFRHSATPLEEQLEFDFRSPIDKLIEFAYRAGYEQGARDRFEYKPDIQFMKWANRRCPKEK